MTTSELNQLLKNNETLKRMIENLCDFSDIEDVTSRIDDRIIAVSEGKATPVEVKAEIEMWIALFKEIHNTPEPMLGIQFNWRERARYETFEGFMKQIYFSLLNNEVEQHFPDLTHDMILKYCDEDKDENGGIFDRYFFDDFERQSDEASREDAEWRLYMLKQKGMQNEKAN